MKIKTDFTKLLGIDLPIVSAPMFLVSYPDLVSAVSNAGGIGTFPSMNYRELPELNDALDEIRSKTNKPIGVNIVLYKEHNPDWSKQLKICLDKKVELIITSLGTPRSVVNEAKSVGSKVFCDVTNLRMAKILAKGGADGLIAVAQGAGGHAGNINPFSLIPYLISETALPVLAAGSIGTGAQMAAALSLGASAVYVGTRFITATESAAKEEYKNMIVNSVPEDIEYTDKVSGLPANWLKSSLVNLEDSSVAKSEIKRWRDIWSAGHGVAQIKNIDSAKNIIATMINEYQQSIQSLPKLLT